MKKILSFMIVAGVITGCSYYDYYESGVRYSQEGENCVYRSNEYAENYSENIKGIDDDKRVIYRNTRCEDLFVRDNGGRIERNDRRALVPTAAPAKPAVKKPKPCATSDKIADAGCGCGELVPVSRQFFAFTDK